MEHFIKKTIIQDSGFGILFALIISGFIGVLSLSIILNRNSATRIIQYDIHGEKARNISTNSLYNSILNSNYLAPTVKCENTRTVVGATAYSSEVCFRHNRILQDKFSSLDGRFTPASFPAINYAAIFKAGVANYCLDTSITIPATNIPITVDAVISNKSCTITNAASAASTNYGNLISEKITINSPSEILSVTGITIINELYLNKDLILLSGGDIFINNLIFENNSNILLISATGVVYIDTFSGMGKGSFIGWAGVYIPSNLPLLSRELLLPQIEKEFITQN